MFFQFWILRKYATSWRKFFDVTILLTVAGISVGVAVLVVAMAGFSGFETTLKRAIIEVVGDVAIYRRGGKIDKVQDLKKKLAPFMGEAEDQLLFLTQESLVSNKGKISATLIQAVEKEKATTVLNLQNRVTEGKVDWSEHDGLPPAFLGKDLMKKMGLKIGDTVKIIVPRTSKSSSSDLRPVLQQFHVAAALDLGKYDFNSRFIFVDLPVIQKLLGVTHISGIRIKLRDSEKAEAWAKKVQEEIGWSYAAVDWRQTNSNYLRAVEYEKMVMFFVVLIIVVAACFNVSTTLFVTVLKRYRDISLMKTMGAKPIDIMVLFSLHGLFLGALGTFIGLALGYGFGQLFELLQKIYPLLPSDIYKLSFVATEIRLHDMMMIGGATMLICFFSTLIPSMRGSMLNPVEGLKYE